MKTTLRQARKVQIAFASASVILLVLGGLSLRSVAMSNRSSQWVEHTRVVLKDIQQMRLAMETIASGIRGYVLTGKESYLATYRTDISTTKQRLADLRRLTADNAEQQHRLSVLEGLANRRFDRAEMTLGLAKYQGMAAAANAIRSGPGQEITRSFQTVVVQMQDEEERLFALRQASARRSLDQIEAILVAGTLLGLLITGAAVWSVHSDITRRKVSEEALRDSEDRYRLLVKNIQGYSIVMLGPMGEILSWNAGAERMTGATSEEVVGRNYSRFFLEEEIQQGRPAEILRMAVANGVHEDHGKRVRKDGTCFLVHTTYTPLRGPAGELRGFSLVSRDVTESVESEAKYRGLLEAAPDPMVVVNQSGEIVLLNLQAEKQFGYHRDELVGQKVTDIIPEGFAERLIADGGRRAADKLAQQIGAGVELTARCKNGNEFPIEMMLSPLDSAEGTLVTAAIRDISARKSMEEILFVEKERAQVTLNSIGDAVICSDISGNITFLNPVAEDMIGWSSSEAAGRPMTAVFKILHGTNREVIPNPMEMAVAQDRTMHLPANCILVQRDGFEIPIEDSIAPIHDRHGQVTGAVIVFRDVSGVRAMAQQMVHAAEHDFLTGLPNRMLLNDRLGQAIARAPRHLNKVAVLFLDLDGFKHINDSLGHPIGDRLLQSIAKRLVDCVRPSDTVSRQGGDEFVVLLSDVEHAEDAAIAARRMLEAVAEAHPTDQRDLHVTASIGVSIYPDDGLNAETLVKNADTAMYHAKENGRQGYRFFKQAMNDRAVERQSIEENLRRALERHEFTLHYQPKIDLTTGAITGAEALIRWTHPTWGSVSPAQFIPIAEDCGLILPIGAWVLREACRQAQAWVSIGLPAISMAVNVSGMEFQDEMFLERLFAVLDETGFDPKYLELELTESVLMKRADTAASILRALRERGIKVSIDDFGTGYSSLSYLRKFPIDALKIDQSFVRQITTAGDDTAIVTAVIGMARSLRLRVVAEGVETPEQLAFLRAHQCDEAQGYYFSRPLPSEDFSILLEATVAGRDFAPLLEVGSAPGSGKNTLKWAFANRAVGFEMSPRSKRPNAA